MRYFQQTDTPWSPRDSAPHEVLLCCSCSVQSAATPCVDSSPLHSTYYMPSYCNAQVRMGVNGLSRDEASFTRRSKLFSIAQHRGYRMWRYIRKSRNDMQQTEVPLFAREKLVPEIKNRLVSQRTLLFIVL